MALRALLINSASVGSLLVSLNSAFAQENNVRASQPGQQILATQRLTGQFARLVATPAECQSARNLPSRSQRAPGPACGAIMSCLQAAIRQTEGGIEYLKRNPSVLDALNRQLQSPASRNIQQSPASRTIRPNYDLLTDLTASLSRTKSGGAPLNCDYAWMIVANGWFNLNPHTVVGHRPFELFLSAGQAVLMNARNDYKPIEAEYHGLITFNDKYAGVDRLHRAQAAYRKAFEDDDVAEMIRERVNVLHEIEQARTRKTLLSKQTEELLSLETRLSSLRGVATRRSHIETHFV